MRRASPAARVSRPRSGPAGWPSILPRILRLFILPGHLILRVPGLLVLSGLLVLPGLLGFGTPVADAAQIVRGPYLQRATADGVTVRWRTDVAMSSRLRLGSNPALLGTEISDPTLSTEHELRAQGLLAGQRYFYEVGDLTTALAGGDSLHHFDTLLPAGVVQPLRIWALGDSGLPGFAQDTVRDAFRAANPGPDDTVDVWLMLGDNAYTTGTDAEYQSGLFVPYADLLRGNVLWPTRGNHDQLHPGSNDDYYEFFTLPTKGESGGMASNDEAYYSFDSANVHFICLDSFGSAVTPTSPMLQWLSSDLGANAQEWTIAYFHHGPYSRGSHDSDVDFHMTKMRENVLPVLEEGGVDLVLGGHSHGYERSFLIDGHYGPAISLVDSNRIDAGDGSRNGNGMYRKPSHGPAPHEGAVYVIAGSSSRLGNGNYDHPAIFTHEARLGSMVIDVDGSELHARFLDSTGVWRDDFWIAKGANSVAAPLGPGLLSLRATPNPSRGLTRLSFTLSHSALVRLEIYDLAGRRVRTLLDGSRGAGPQQLSWNGHDQTGRRVARGVYLGRLSVDGRRVATARISLLR